MSAAVETTPAPPCAVCRKEGVSRCSQCRAAFYCGADCQRADWQAHKGPCAATPQWYDKHRKCQDRSLHEGRLELITWACTEDGTGWGACLADESEDLKKQFEGEYGGDEEKFYEYWPQGFRWTCCGTNGDMDYGCDHHGSGKKPCSCDYCVGGEPLPDDIYLEKSASRQGLKLRRGPDPRSGGGMRFF